MSYAATFDVQPPKEFDKAQVLLRVLIIVVISVLQINNIIFGGTYLILPVVAAVLISQKGAEQFLAEAEDGPTKWLRYLMAFYSYMALATDRFPTKQPEEIVQLNVQAGGSPTVGSALLRLILGIPHAIALRPGEPAATGALRRAAAAGGARPLSWASCLPSSG